MSQKESASALVVPAKSGKAARRRAARPSSLADVVIVRERNRTLTTTEQERQVKRDLIDKTPDQMKLPFALWTRDAGRKVFLILDNLRVHHSKKVTRWLEEHKEQIAIFYLPSYSL
jgi:pyruvate kinase